MKHIKYTFGTTITAFVYFIAIDTYYYFIGLYTAFYGSLFEAIVGGQKFAIINSYWKLLIIPLVLDFCIYLQKRGKNIESKIDRC